MIAWIFPGQGSQTVGMGKSFYDAFSQARALFEQANDLLHLDVTKVVFEGPEERLKQTLYSQLGIYITSMAILRVLQTQFPSLKPALCAGHSLGEYSALTAAGWLSFEKCLPLVRYRAEVMEEACRTYPGTMAALLGVTEEQVEQLVAKVGKGLWAANFNCPGQIVISGTAEAMEQAQRLAKEIGIKRIIPLAVQGAFHSGLMQQASEKLNAHLQETVFASQGIPLILNATAQKATSAEQIRKGVMAQMTSSVRWEQSMGSLQQVTQFIEIGEGKVLAGLNKKIGVPGPTLSIGTVTDLEILAKEVE